jgi:peptidyl-Lys metalloendopeptidase
MRHKLVGCLLVVVVLLGWLASPAAAAPRGGGGLTVRLESDGYFGLTERPTVGFTLSNRTGVDVYLLRWQTPIDGINTELFEVTREGEPVAYTGRLVKFGNPRPEDYVRVAAGESLSMAVDLAGSYDFSRTGEYSVRYHAFAQDVLLDAAPLKVLGITELVSNRTGMAVERDPRTADLLEKLMQIEGKAASTGFAGCSSGEQSALNTARSNATNYSNGSKSYLDGHSASTAGPRYTTWFGAPTTSLYNTVGDHFDAILAAFQNAAIVFDCGTCKTDPNYNNYYAYVYSSQAYKIYLCGAFWSAGATGTDSKAGTLVHEMSHFNVTAGTNDNAYGQAACKKLAQKNPRKAVDNTDSHEYFAENTPSLN